jgi:hypothetical protein
VRLWKNNYDLDKCEEIIKGLDYKYANFTHVKIDAKIINLTD